MEDVKKGEILGEYDGRRFGPTKILSGMREMYAFSTHSDVMVSPADDCPFRYANDVVDLEQSLLHKKIVNHANLTYNINWHIDKDSTREAKQLLATHGKKCYLDRKFLNMERVQIIATQDIQAGSELFLDYGDGFWRTRITDAKFRVKFPPVSGEALTKFLEEKVNIYWKRLEYYGAEFAD